MKVACRTNGFPSLKSPCLLLLLDAGEGGMLHPDRALTDVSFSHRTTSIPFLRDRPELSGRAKCDQFRASCSGLSYPSLVGHMSQRKGLHGRGFVPSIP